jgi:hypothetical protein
MGSEVARLVFSQVKRTVLYSKPHARKISIASGIFGDVVHMQHTLLGAAISRMGSSLSSSRPRVG